MKKVIKKIAYSALNVATLGKGLPRSINGYKILFPPRWSRYFESDYEKENITFLGSHCKKGNCVIDVGAHLGLFSVIAGKLVSETGKVFAFEPTPDTFKALNEVVRLNHLSKIITPVNSAVADFNGETRFFVGTQAGNNANSLVERVDQKRNNVTVNVVTIDSFVDNRKIAKIDLLKIDAEGTELLVLKGAEKTLKAHRPKIILAIHPSLIKNNNNSLEEIHDLIINYGFKIVFKEQPMSRSSFCTYADFFDVHLFPV